jgi:two-component system, response regulator PdtaR
MSRNEDKIRVLIVEDEDIIAQDIQETLRENGFAVAGIVDRGEHALAYFKDCQPDLVMLDINLAGQMDGIETAAMLKSYKDIPIIFLSGLSDQETISRAVKIEPDAYLTKPYNSTQLQASIHAAIRKHSGGEQVEDKPGKATEHFIVNDSIFVKKHGRYHKIPIDDIQWLEVNDYLLTIVTAKGNYPLIFSLSKFVNKLGRSNIIQVHRSFAVNIGKVDTFDRNSLRIGEKVIPVSRSSRQAFLEHFMR